MWWLLVTRSVTQVRRQASEGCRRQSGRGLGREAGARKPHAGCPGGAAATAANPSPSGQRLHPRLRPADHPARAVHEVKIVRSPEPEEPAHSRVFPSPEGAHTRHLGAHTKAHTEAGGTDPG